MKHQNTCIICNKQFNSHWSTTLTCSPSCKRQRKLRTHRERYTTPFDNINKPKLGAVSELELCAHYLREGYEVFRNVSNNGPADLIIWKPENGELHIVDVKTFNRSNQCEESINNYVKHMEVNSADNVKVVPFNHHSKTPLRHLSDPLE